jgi:prepilin-type processing-associated H-X9-DG protein
MLVEVADSGVHWAAPRDLTVEEAINGLKTGKGLHISTALKNKTNVLMADGHLCYLPTKTPLSLWKKLLAGELSRAEIDDISSLIDPNAPDMVDVSVAPKGFEPGTWGIVFSVLVWLFSLVLLFRRAIKSRKPVEIVKMENVLSPPG